MTTTEQQERIDVIAEKWRNEAGDYPTLSDFSNALTELQLACNKEKEELWQQVLSVRQILDERNEALNNRMNQVGSLTAKVAELEVLQAKSFIRSDELVEECYRIQSQFLAMNNHSCEQADRIASLESQLKAATDTIACAVGGNGGPVDGEDTNEGGRYVLVQIEAFKALEEIWRTNRIVRLDTQPEDRP